MAQITVPQGDAIISYALVSPPPATPLAINYPFFALGDIQITVIRDADDIVQVLVPGVDFNVSGVAVDDGYSSGTATLISGSLPSGKYNVRRDTPVEKLSNWPTTGAFSIYAENTLWSKHTAWHQERLRESKRSIRAPNGEILNSMPSLDIRKNKMLVFDAAGNPIASTANADDLLGAAAASAAAAAASATDAAESAAEAAASVASIAGYAASAAASASAAAGSASDAATQAAAAAASAGAAAASETLAHYWADQAALTAVTDATETNKGIAEIANFTEIDAATDNTRIVTPAKMAYYVALFGTGPGPSVPYATDAIPGIIRVATIGEVTGGTSSPLLAVPPHHLQTYVAAQIAAIPVVPAASESVAGKAELATTGEVTTGTDDLRIVTPLKLQQKLTALDLSNVYVGKVGAQQMAGPLGIGGAAPAGQSLYILNPADHALAMIEAPTAGKVAQLTLKSAVSYFTLNARETNSFFLADGNAGAVRLIIDAAGNVGIGPNLTPTARLHIYAANGSALIQSTAVTDTSLSIKHPSHNWILMNGSDSKFYLYSAEYAAIRLSVAPDTGVTTIGGAGSPANYDFLKVLGTIGSNILVNGGGPYPAGISLENSLARWTWQVGGSDGFIRLYRAAGQVVGIDTANNAYFAGFVSTPLVCGSTDGNAGKLLTYNSGVVVTFEWTGGALYARLDNGAVRLQIW